jgi:hypothetical protein
MTFAMQNPGAAVRHDAGRRHDHRHEAAVGRAARKALDRRYDDHDDHRRPPWSGTIALPEANLASPSR